MNRRALLHWITTAALAGAGPRAGAATPLIQGSLQTRSITSGRNRTTYPINLYVPPGDDRPHTPTIYLLDGETRFPTLVDIAEASGTRVIIVGIGNEAMRSHDYVPANGCTADGGGEAAFLDFVRFELIPFIETDIGGDPTRRVLMGHSHGGSFALYAMFSEAPGTHHFGTYLAADPSIRCIGAPAFAWETAYAARHDRLPVALYLAYANPASEPYVRQIEARRYVGLRFRSQAYPGGHNGMVQAAFTDELQFAVASH